MLRLKAISLIALLTGVLVNKFQGQVNIFSPTANLGSLQIGFTTVPNSIQTSVYWYWISDNISKECVVEDLEAMKKVGITGILLRTLALNTCVDRPVGDGMLPKEQRPTFLLFGPEPRNGLESSGLLGPINIEFIQY